MAGFVAELNAVDLRATLTVNALLAAPSILIDWGDGTIEDHPILGLIEGESFPHDYATQGTYTVVGTATGFDELEVVLPVIGPLTVAPSTLGNFLITSTNFNVSSPISFVTSGTLIWDDATRLWDVSTWNSQWDVTAAWKADVNPWTSDLQTDQTHLSNGTVDVLIPIFDPYTEEGAGQLLFTVYQTVRGLGVTNCWVQGIGIVVIASIAEPPPPNYPSDWPTEPGEMNFRLWEQNIGFLDLSCENGFIVREYDIAFPTVRDVVYDLSLDDGTADLTRYFGSRAVSLDLTLRPSAGIDGSGVQYSESKMRDLLLRFSEPYRRPYLYYSEFGDYRCRRIWMRPASGSLAVSLPRFNRVNLGFVASDPFIQSFDEHCTTGTLDFTVATTELAVENKGNTGSHWVATLTGEMIKPEITLDGNPEWSIQLNYNAKKGDVVTLHSRSKTVMVNNIPAGYTYVNDKSRWFKIPPGEHTFDITHYDIAPDPPAGGDLPKGAWAPWTTPPPDEAQWSGGTPLNPQYTGWSVRAADTILTICYRDTWI